MDNDEEIKISEFEETTESKDDDILYIIQNGVSQKTKKRTLFNKRQLETYDDYTKLGFTKEPNNIVEIIGAMPDNSVLVQTINRDMTFLKGVNNQYVLTDKQGLLVIHRAANINRVSLNLYSKVGGITEEYVGVYHNGDGFGGWQLITVNGIQEKLLWTGTLKENGAVTLVDDSFDNYKKLLFRAGNTETRVEISNSKLSSYLRGMASYTTSISSGSSAIIQITGINLLKSNGGKTLTLQAYNALDIYKTGVITQKTDIDFIGQIIGQN